MKTCIKCEIQKELEEFHKNSQNKDGLCGKCKNCIKEYDKEYRNKNEKKIKQQKREYALNNSDKIKEYKKENKEEIRKWQNEYQRERKKNDPIFKMQCNLRTLNHQAIKRGYKSASTQELLGCTWEEAKIYIESLFLPGMTWENWTINGWHLDHIKPIAAFTDLTDPEQQRQCCHYTNLRPLWAEDNYEKSSIWEGVRY